MTVSVDELVSGSFNFFLWADNETVSNQITTVEDNSHHVVDLKLIGECYVGINKFFFSHTEIVILYYSLNKRILERKMEMANIKKLTLSKLMPLEKITDILPKQKKNSGFMVLLLEN
jgi:hypothetical protein